MYLGDWFGWDLKTTCWLGFLNKVIDFFYGWIIFCPRQYTRSIVRITEVINKVRWVGLLGKQHFWSKR